MFQVLCKRGMRELELTVDSVQLTVVVSLRDELNLFISEGSSLIVNCQLSTVNLFRRIFVVIGPAYRSAHSR